MSETPTPRDFAAMPRNSEGQPAAGATTGGAHSAVPGAAPGMVPGAAQNAAPGMPGADPIAEVEAARDRLAGLDDLPVAGHVAVYDEIHRVVQSALATLDRG